MNDPSNIPPNFHTRPNLGFPNPNPRPVFRPNWKRKPNKPSSSSSYKPPTLHELQHQNRLKARRFYPKKHKHPNRFAPFAPRNTTSFIIRSKKAGGIPDLVSPCPVTPAILPTPRFSPSREGLVDMAKEEWGVDGYGSMKGLIRLRSPNAMEEIEDGSGSSDSEVEEHVEVERRLDHDLSRFEMVYQPNYGEDGGGFGGAAYLLENRVDDQDAQIAQLEEENLTLKERLFLMERELGELKSRLLVLEAGRGEGNNGDEVAANADGNHEDVSDGDVCSEKSGGD